MLETQWWALCETVIGGSMHKETWRLYALLRTRAAREVVDGVAVHVPEDRAVESFFSCFFLFISFLVFSSLLFSFLFFLPFPFLFLFACMLRKGSGSHVNVCPRPCFEHQSMGEACNPPTQRTTPTVWSVLSCPLWPCYHRMCVMAKGLDSHRWLAHAAGHRHFSSASTSGRTVPVSKSVHVWKARYKKLEIVFPWHMVVIC